MAATIAVARRGQQRSLTRIFQPLSSDTARRRVRGYRHVPG